MDESDKCPEQRHARDEGLGAVDRIEHPYILGVRPVDSMFLADNPVLGKPVCDHAAHPRFGGAVGDRHRRSVVLSEHFDAGAKIGPDDAPGRIGEL